jgi:hypothetical protein
MVSSMGRLGLQSTVDSALKQDFGTMRVVMLLQAARRQLRQ